MIVGNGGAEKKVEASIWGLGSGSDDWWSRVEDLWFRDEGMEKKWKLLSSGELFKLAYRIQITFMFRVLLGVI